METLEELWVKAPISAHSLIDDITIAKAIRTRSNHTLTQLKRKVYRRLWFCVSLFLISTAFIPFASHLSIQILIAILSTAYLIGSILLFQENKLLKTELDMSQSLLATLILFQTKIHNIIRFEELISLILYPISSVAGFLLGMTLYNPNTQFLNDPFDWIVLLMPLTILVPGSHFFNQWLNRRSFGQYLKALQQDIDELKIDQ